MTFSTTATAVALSSLVLACLAACEPQPVREFKLTVRVDGEGSILVLPDDEACDDRCFFSAEVGSFFSFIARPDDGHVFVGWSGDCNSSGDRRVVDVEVAAEVDCTATFEPDPVLVAEGPELSVDVLGPGAILSTPVGIDCSGTDGNRDACAARFLAGSFVTLQAQAVAGATFIGFSDDCEVFDNGDGSAGIFVDEDTRCGATFLEDNVAFPVRIEVEGQGRVTSSPGGINCIEGGQQCEALFGSEDFLSLEATADPGWTFASWGHLCAGVPDAFFDIGPVDFAIACSARFVRTFFIAIEGEGRVDAVTDDGPFTCDSFDFSCQTPSVPSTLTATANAGSRFVRWAGDCAGTDVVVAVDALAGTCTAVFERLPPGIVVDIQGPGRVVADLEGDIDCPGDCVAEGVGGGGGIDPGPGEWVCDFAFFGSGDGCDCGCGVPDPDCASSSASVCGFCGDGCGLDCDEIAPDQNHLCVIGEDPTALQRTLRAIADNDAVFLGWSGDCFGSNATTFVSTFDTATCTATFAAGLRVDVVGRGSVRTSDGDTCTTSCGFAPLPASLTATAAAANARFVGWQGDCAGNSATVDVDASARACTAVFEDIPAQIDITVVGPGTALVSPDVVCAGPDVCAVIGTTTTMTRTIDAQPDPRSIFTGFSGGCSAAAGVTRTTLVATSPTVRTCTLTFVAAVELVVSDADIAIGSGVLAFAGDGSDVVFVDDNSNVEVFDAATGFLQGRTNLFDLAIFDTIVGAAVADDGTVLLFDDANVAWLLPALAPTAAVELRSHTQPITAAAFDDAGDLAFTADAIGRVKVWARASGLVQRTLVAHTGVAVGVGFVAGFVVSAGADGRVVTHRSNSNVLVDEEVVFGGAAVTVFAASRDRVLVGAADGSLRLFTVDSSGALVAGPTATVASPLTHASLSTSQGTVIAAGQLLLVDTTDLSTTAAGPAQLALSSSTRVLRRDLGGAVALLDAAGGVERRFAVDLGRGFRQTEIVAGTATFVSSGKDGLFFDDANRTLIPSIRGRDLVPANAGFVFVANVNDGIDRVAVATGVATRIVDDANFYLRVRTNPAGDLIAATPSLGSDDVTVFEVSTGERFRGFSAAADAEDLAFLDDDTLAVLFSTFSSGTLRLVRISDATVIDEVALPFAPVRFATTDNTIVVVGASGVSGRVVAVDISDRADLGAGAVVNVEEALTAVAVRGDGVVVVAREGGAVGVVDVGAGIVHPAVFLAPLPEDSFLPFGAHVFDLDVTGDDVIASTVDGLVRLAPRP